MAIRVMCGVGNLLRWALRGLFWGFVAFALLLFVDVALADDVQANHRERPVDAPIPPPYVLAVDDSPFRTVVILSERADHARVIVGYSDSAFLSTCMRPYPNDVWRMCEVWKFTIHGKTPSHIWVGERCCLRNEAVWTAPGREE